MKKEIILVIIVLCFLNTIQAQQCTDCNNPDQSGGSYSSKLGFNNTALGDYSFSGGIYSEANARRSFSYGNYTTTGSNATGAIVLGSHVEVFAPYAFVFGTSRPDQHLYNALQETMMIGFNSSKPTLFISRSPSPPPGNTLYDRTGKVSIGNMTDPQAKLHIYSDDDESATLFLEPSNWTTAYNPEIWFGNTNNKISADISLGMIYSTQNYHSFQNGNVGIGTSTPRAKVHVKDGDIFIEDIEHGIVMKSPDGNCWRGTLNNQGQLQFAQVNCDDLMVSTPESEAGQNDGVSIYPNPTGDRVTVEIPGVHAGAQLSIQSSAGSELEILKLNGIKNIVDLSVYPAGGYFFRITGKDGRLMASKTVIKK